MRYLNIVLLFGQILDGGGIYGHLLHYSLIASFTGGALLIYFYLWRKGELDMDESPKFQMMENEEDDGRR